MFMEEIIKGISYISIIAMLVHPLAYRKEDLLINGKPQQVHTLEIDLEKSKLEIKNALSFDVLYGFEETSSIAKRHNAIAAVNGMFYDNFGYPYGIIVSDGQVLSMNDYSTPTVIVTESGQVLIDDIHVEGNIIGEKNKAPIFGVNRGVYTDTYVIFNRVNGKTTRVSRQSINYIIEDEHVVDIIFSDQPVAIEKDQTIITTVTDKYSPIFSVGEKVILHYSYTGGINNVKEAFQTGGWLVKNGENVVNDFETLMGFMKASSPRTIIGITEHGKLIIKVIDGRNKGVSVGINGREAAELMLFEGCRYAAFLDGGASSTMLLRNEVVNRPSNNNEERAIAHAVIFQWLEGD